MLKDSEDRSTCLGIQLLSKHDTSINMSDVYAVEFIDWGLVHETLLTNPGFLLGHASEVGKSRPFCVYIDSWISFLVLVLSVYVYLLLVDVSVHGAWCREVKKSTFFVGSSCFYVRSCR